MSAMKTLSEILTACALACLALFIAPAALAQQGGPPDVGFIRIVNAVAPGEGRVNVLVDGEDIFPRGYTLGQRTGGIGLKAGTINIEVRREGVESGTTRLPLPAGETVTLIAFAEKNRPRTEDEPPTWSIKLLRLRQSSPERGYRLTIVSVSEHPEHIVQAAVQGKGTIERAFARRLDVATLDLGQARGEVLVKVGDDILTTVSPEDPGNYVVVLYDDEEGVTRALTFFDPRFVIAG